MKQSVIDLRSSITGLRSHIELEHVDTWYPVYRFEGVYEMTLDGKIRKFINRTEVKVYHGKKYDMVTLRHPDGDGSTLVVNLIDLWVATFLGNHRALNQYSYMDSIKHHRN